MYTLKRLLAGEDMQVVSIKISSEITKPVTVLMILCKVIESRPCFVTCKQYFGE